MSERKPIPTATPEAVGIASEHIEAFVRRLNARKLNLHSVLVIRHGQLAAEGYWAPFTAADKHRMYSVSKSFTAIAVGKLIGEGKVSLTDPIVKFFPDKLPEQVHPYLAGSQVQDLLRMADAHLTDTYKFTDMDWIDTYFKTPPTHLAGKIFTYNTSATVTLCAMVERVTGMPFLQYLRPEFDKLGVSEDIWCIQTPCGYSFGGSGVICTSRDLAKVALMMMNGGRVDGEQLLPADYVAAATGYQIDNRLTNHDFEHQQGYGYQIWRTRHNGFSFYGMGSQLAVCLPERDLLLVTTGDTQDQSPDTTEILEAFWEEIYDKLADEPLPEAPEAQRRLSVLLDSLAMAPVEGARETPAAQRVSGRTYRLDDNPMGIAWARFDFAGGEGSMTYANQTGEHTLRFGFGRHIQQAFPETHYSGSRINTPLGKGYRCHGSAAWADGRALIIRIAVTDVYLGTLNINATFDGDTVTLLMTKTAEAFLNEYQGFASGRAE
ncbi:MAG: serine hydrolase domain-containing protein [Christensenellales bacterium]|jgi:CubicO group peptidase (beta-lactamase class C family)